MKKVIISKILIGITFVTNAQSPISWSFTTSKISEKTFEIHITPIVEKPWHIYSQTSPEGGALPTKIVFNKNPLVIADGEVKEVGKIVTKYEEVFGVEVKYFDGKVDFVQFVKLKANVKTNVSGSVEFMVCNDQQCLPPATINFSIALK